jgi:cyclopropane fatty-acyl-phospholipid synthase-like methyltransferase
MDVLVSMARYNFVNRTVNDPALSVLDFGCGSGYGTRILKERFRDVTSFDVYPDNYAPPGVKVIQDIKEIGKRKYDVVTCFEVIEHLEKTDQPKLMSDLANLVSDNGTLFISTVRRMDPPPTENRKVEHKHELTFDELLAHCNMHFSNVFTFGQIDQVISTFYKENHYHFVFICTGKKK